MVTFNEVNEKFKEHNCKLLMTKEEFNKKKRIVKEKYKYIASCGHPHEVLFNSFKRFLHGIICKKCSMLKYNDLKETFKKHNCQLLMTEEEFNLKPRKTIEKYKYIASCGHNHEVSFSHFKERLQGLNCPQCSIITYNDLKETFKKHNCQLLMTEEEFNLKPRKNNEKYKYIASCNHQHEICFNEFKNKLSCLICPKCVKLKQSIDNKEKYKLNPVLTNDLEFESIEHLKTIIGDTFDVKYIGEGCLADFCIRLKHITEDKWLMVQMKSTTKPTSKGYNFSCKSKYINCIIMCMCLSNKKMWIFDGNTITTTGICIGLTKSKYDKFEITKDTILGKITHYYNNNTFPKYDFETIDTPITPEAKLEREYRIYRETMIHCLPFIRNERQGLVYDFIANGFKVQEKVSSQMKNKTYTKFELNKSNSRVNRVKQHISYQKGDNDFYWLNVNNKKQFYIIPEHELLSRNIINIDKSSSITLNPISKRGKHSWANEYLFDYTKFTKIDEEKIKTMFSLV